MPSRSEGFPLALLEAMMFYKPIVCSDISIFREIFTQGEAALFKLEDINSLISAIKLAMGNTTMGEQMYHHYYMYFTPEKMCGRYLAVYNGEI